MTRKQMSVCSIQMSVHVMVATPYKFIQLLKIKSKTINMEKWHRELMDQLAFCQVSFVMATAKFYEC